MLGHFGELREDVQKFLLDICNRCRQCHGCTHGGRIKGGKDQNIVVEYESESVSVCPSFPVNQWEKYDEALINALFEYHEMQNKYNPN